MRVRIRIVESASLKDKRQLIRSLSQRIRNKFQAAVAEVDDNDEWQLATLGIAVVSNEHRQCEVVLNAIESHIRETRLDAEIIELDTDIVQYDRA
jgi:uncharacterized protein YlxP (DUF503 family)